MLSLTFNSPRFEDKRWYYVFISTGTLSFAKTTQPIFMDACEGQEVNIPCNHTNIATNEYIFWYQQFPNQGPTFVFQGYKNNETNKMASLFIAADRKTCMLSLPWASLRETAVYYCIVSDTVRQAGLHLYSIPLRGGSEAQEEAQSSAC